ncbi:MAG TPA: YbhB/YbcL family Raf kinase inhibitor-like protein [Longimicrobiales bacterium]
MSGAGGAEGRAGRVPSRGGLVARVRGARGVAVLAVIAGIGLALGGCGREGAEGRQTAEMEGDARMRLTSPEFEDGERIPERFTCDGEDVSPPLVIRGVPDSARTLALVFDDPDAPRGEFVHWLLWNVPPDVSTLPEAIPPSEVLEGFGSAAQGRNGFRSIGYRGPCPPPGPDHHYRFRLFALDTTLALAPGADREGLEDAMTGHVLEEALLTGRYAR